MSDQTDSLLLWLDDIYPRDPRAAELRRTWPKLAEILDDLTGAKAGDLVPAGEGGPVEFIVGPSDETLAALEAFMAAPRDERMTP